MRILILLTLVAGLCWGQSITNAPVDTAQRSGQAAQLNCTVDKAGIETTIFWKLYSQGDSEGSEVYNSVDGVADTGNYGIDTNACESGTNCLGEYRYNLIVNSASSTTAGKYECGTYATSTAEEAELVSVDAVVTEQIPYTSPIDTSILLVCQVTYIGAIAPKLQWRIGPDPYLTATNTTDTTVTATMEETSSVHLDETIATCDLTFEPSPPTYIDSCEQIIRVGDPPTGPSTPPSTGPPASPTATPGSTASSPPSVAPPGGTTRSTPKSTTASSHTPASATPASPTPASPTPASSTPASPTPTSPTPASPTPAPTAVGEQSTQNSAEKEEGGMSTGAIIGVSVAVAALVAVVVVVVLVKLFVVGAVAPAAAVGGEAMVQSVNVAQTVTIG